MKKIVTIGIVFTAAVIVFINACGKPNMKKLSGGNNVEHMLSSSLNGHKVTLANKIDSMLTYKKFRAEAIRTLGHNVTDISVVKACVDTCKNIDKEVVKKQIDSLENKNNELIVKLDKTKADKNWKKTKKTLKSDLEMLSFSLKSLKKEKRQ